MEQTTFNLVEMEQERILDNIIEGYPVTAHRSDGYAYTIWMEYIHGLDCFYLRFGSYTQRFSTWEGLVNHIRRHTFTRIDY